MARPVDPVVIGAGHGLYLPTLVGADQRPRGHLHAPPAAPLAGQYRHDLTGLERIAVQPANAGLVKGRARAEHKRRVNAAGNGDIGPCAELGEGHRQRLTGAHRHALPHRAGKVIELGLHVGAGQGDDGVGLKAQSWAHELTFEAGVAGRVADQQVGQTK